MDPFLDSTDDPNALQAFFDANPYFRRSELVDVFLASGRTKVAAKRALAHQVSRGRIETLRRGLYKVRSAEDDFFTLASKLVPKGVVSHAGALAWHGVISDEERFVVSSEQKAPRFEYGDIHFHIVKHRLPIDQAFTRTTTLRRYDAKVCVTNLGRTLVDCLDRPELAFLSLEELFEAFVRESDLNVDLVEAAEHAVALGSATTAARLAAFAWGHPKWRPQMNLLAPISSLLPSTAVYVDAHREPQGKYLAELKIIIPPDLQSAFTRVKHPPQPKGPRRDELAAQAPDLQFLEWLSSGSDPA